MANKQVFKKAVKPVDAFGFTPVQHHLRKGEHKKAATIVRRGLKRIDTAAEFNRWSAAANAFDLARWFQAAPEAWESFRRDSGFFAYAPRKDAYLTACCQYLYGAKDGALGQRARRDARAMKGCWEQLWTAQRLFQHLHQPVTGGFRSLPKAPKRSFRNRPNYRLYVGEADVSLIDALEIGGRIWIGAERCGSGRGMPKLKIITVRALRNAARKTISKV